MIDYVSAMKQAITAKVMASCAVDALGERIASVAGGFLRGHVDGKEYRIGEHLYKVAHSSCRFSAYDCEQGKDPVELQLLLHKIGGTKTEKSRAYTASTHFLHERWYMLYDKPKEDAWKYRLFRVTVEQAITGDYNLSM